MVKKIIALLLAAVMIFACCSCGSTDSTDSTGTTAAENTEKTGQLIGSVKSTEETGQEPSETEEESVTETESGSGSEEISPDTAMENFIKKLDAGNYVVEMPKKGRTSVVSPDLVYLYYYHDIAPYGYAFMTRENETFMAEYEGDEIKEITFRSPGNAIEAMGSLLPNSWMEASGGNMFNFFYNNVDNPLEFTSKEDTIKSTLIALGGYSEKVLELMQEVHMLLDAEDPGSVRFTAEVTDISGSIYHYDDLDLTLQFGTAESMPVIEDWLDDPVYPSVKTGWTRDDIETLDLVFFRDYGADTVPFPSFASYALIFDPYAYRDSSSIILSDAHAREQDVEDYKALLLENGYAEATADLPDGSSATVYRRSLREDYGCYAQLYPYYDEGFVLWGSLYYECPAYDGLQAISGTVQEHGFAALDDTDIFTGWYAENHAGERSEGWAYFFDYNLYMPFILGYSDQAAARDYLEAYGNKLIGMGYAESYVPGEDSRKYESANQFISFRYTFNENDTVTLEFKNEKSLTPEEVKNLLQEHGLPETDIHGDIGARDHTRYYYIISSFKGLRLMIYQPYATRGEAEGYLDSYTAMLEEMGYYTINPEKVGSQRQYVYFNEDLRKYVGFDYLPGETDATIGFELVSIEPDEESLMQSMIGR